MVSVPNLTLRSAPNDAHKTGLTSFVSTSVSQTSGLTELNLQVLKNDECIASLLRQVMVSE